MDIEILLECIFCFINGQTPKNIEFKDWQQYHLESFCYYYTYKQMPAPWSDHFRKIFNYQAARSIQLEHQWKTLKTLLLQNEIRFCPLKGADLAFRIYPHAALRPMCDFDLLVHPDDCLKAWNLMQTNGWKSPFLHGCEHHLSVLTKDNYSVELHFKMPGMTNLPVPELFDEIERDKDGVFRLPVALNLIMLFCHAMNHQWQNGIRMLLDMLYLLKKEEWPTAEINYYCTKWQLSNPQLVRAAFPKLFGNTTSVQFSEEVITDFRTLIFSDTQWNSCKYEILMNSSNTFSGSWLLERFKGCHPNVIRDKYRIYKGQYGKLLYYYIKDLSIKLHAFFQYRHKPNDPELYAYIKRLERVQNIIKQGKSIT